MTYSDVDKGQVYEDYVILGWHIREGIYNFLRENKRILGYSYFKEALLLDKFYKELYEGKNSLLKVYSANKDLQDTNIIYLNNTIDPSNIKMTGTMESTLLDKYIKKVGLLMNRTYNLYSKEEIKEEVERYINSRDLEYNSIGLLKGLLNIFNTSLVKEKAYLHKLNFDFINTNVPTQEMYYYQVAFLKTKKGYGFLELSDISTSTDAIYKDIKKRPRMEYEYLPILSNILTYDFIGYIKYLPKYFKVIKDINNINDIFENYVRAIVYSQGVY